MPISLTGTPSSCAIARAMPPLAVPSSLVSAMPDTSTASRNSSAWRRPFWPVVASIVSSVSCGAPGAWRSITLRTLRSSSIRCCWVCSRPAVSTITTSCPRARAASMASKATAPGSDPGSPRTISQPARSAHSVSCSAAAARKVSAAASSTDRPELLLEVPGDLADRRRLAAAVDAHHQDHRRLLGERDRVAVRRAPCRRAAPAAAGSGRRRRRARPARPRARGARRSPRWSARRRRRRSAPPRAARRPRRRATGTPWPAAPRRAPGASSTCCRAAGGRSRAAPAPPRPRPAAARPRPCRTARASCAPRASLARRLAARPHARRSRRRRGGARSPARRRRRPC